MGRAVCDSNPKAGDYSLKFVELSLKGAFLIQPDFIQDERGFFARCFCSEEFKQHDLHTHYEQFNISYNLKKGTLRGMHYQVGDKSEIKIVRCTLGKIFDVIIDLRPTSETYKQWLGVELSADNRCLLYIPQEFAHGFQTLDDHSEVFYQMSASFSPVHSRGIRWNDGQFKIKWPYAQPSTISIKDQHYPDFHP